MIPNFKPIPSKETPSIIPNFPFLQSKRPPPPKRYTRYDLKLTCYTVGKSEVQDQTQQPLEIWNEFHKLCVSYGIL
ncbi:hypothetical protein HanIR_Chr17g0900331 [Helianthus annuus]|nr:hypothetical protein HanIR_Chr17g0900331 [Helianthus annuus]